MIKVIGIISLLLIAVNCNTTEPPVGGKTITLALENISCTEAWIKLVTTNLQFPVSVTVRRSESGGEPVSKTINLVNPDTLLYVDSLLPNTIYQFRASSIQHLTYSNQLQVTTLDTT
ncbi:MAG: glucosyl transferase, partial [Ignavibacteria bacterium]